MTRRLWEQHAKAAASTLMLMKDRLARLGLWRTMHALDKATNQIGFEMDDIIHGKQQQPWVKSKSPKRTRGRP